MDRAMTSAAALTLSPSSEDGLPRTVRDELTSLVQRRSARRRRPRSHEG